MKTLDITKSHNWSVFGRSVVLGAATLLVAAVHAQNFGEWGPAVSVDPNRVNGVNTPFNDGCPIEAPEGHRLFLASDRSGDLDIWMAYRATTSEPWMLQERLPSPVNESPSNEFCPTALPGNGLLFVSTRSNLCGGATNNPDIYYSRFHPILGWLPPEHLGCEVNSGFEEFSPSLVEASDITMLFFSSNRADGVRHKIYMSLLLPDGSWGPPTLVNELNSAASDARPNVRKDGLEIVFDSTRGGGPPQIYSAMRSSVFEPWSAPQLLGPNVNLPAFAQSRPSISRDGKRLYFGSTRDNQAGDRGSDVFVSTRSGPGRGNRQ